MNKVITRDIVHRQFQMHDTLTLDVFDRIDLFERIDKWKRYLHETLRVKKGERVGFALTILDLNYFALFFACSELGLTIVVMDWPKQFTANSLRVAGVLPIHYYLFNADLTGSAAQYAPLSMRLIDVREIDLTVIGSHPVDHPSVTEDDVFMVCTSSGTSNTPKGISHSHAFFHEITMRNRFLFDGTTSAIHIKNLHHGSSLATYFLPSLAACSTHFNAIGRTEASEYAEIVASFRIENIQFSYPSLANDFFAHARDGGLRFSDLRVFTLTYVIPDWQRDLATIGVSEVTAIFGASEASGPVMISKLTPDAIGYDPRDYYLVDDFYNVEYIDDGSVHVRCGPYVDYRFSDRFETIPGGYRHLGRRDFTRVDGTIVDLAIMDWIIEGQRIDGKIVCDSVRNRIHLALWSEPDDVERLIKHVDTSLAKTYPNTSLRVFSTKVLRREDFLSGIKLDMELLREAFR